MNIGLVLSGGVAKGAYQVGFLKAFEEETKNTSVKISGISCASVGIFGGYAYAADKLDVLCDMWSKLHFDSTADLMYDVWFKHFLRNTIHELVDEKDVLKIPVYSPICYLPFVHMNYYRLYGSYFKKWRRYILGAVSYPFLSGGIHWFKGQIAFDGGAMDNIPVLPLLNKEKVDMIIILHFNAGFRPRKKHLDHKIPIVDYDISLDSPIRKYTFDFHHDNNIRRIEDGYSYGKKICSLLFDGGKNDPASILAAAEQQKNKEFEVRLSNITLDTWVQRLNNIVYPFLSKTKIKVRDLCGPVKENTVKENIAKEEQKIINEKVQ